MTIETLPTPGQLATSAPLVDLAEWVSAASQAHQLVNGLVDSFFIPEAYKVRVAPNASPEERAAARAVAVANGTGAVLLGRSLGVDPLTSLQQIYVVHGRPGMYAKFKVALATAAGCEIWADEVTDESVTVSGRARNSDRVHTVTITMEMAKKAGWTSNAAYAKTPQDMLYSRASGRVADRVASNILFGIASIEDLTDGAYDVSSLPKPDPAPRLSAADVLNRQVTAAAEVAPASAEGAAPAPAAPAAEPAAETGEAVTPAQNRKLNSVFGELQLSGRNDREKRLAVVRTLAGLPDLGSSTELTKQQAGGLIDKLEQLAAKDPAERTAALDFMLAPEPAAAPVDVEDRPAGYGEMTGDEAEAEAAR